jgi:hypothetical protein
MRKLPLKLRYRPRRVVCPRCGVRVEDFPWAEPWARVTTALSNAVAVLARELSWKGTARQYGLNWKSVATIVKRAVQYGLALIRNYDQSDVYVGIRRAQIPASTRFAIGWSAPGPAGRRPGSPADDSRSREHRAG